MKKFLQELERAMEKLPAAERAELAEAYRRIVLAVSSSQASISNRFKPSAAAVLGLLMALGGALRAGPKFIADLKKLAPTIGPHVTALVQTL